MKNTIELGPWITWIVIAVMPLAGFTVDIYTPSLPALTNFLHTTESQGKLTLAIFIFGYGIGQLFVGPLSDRYGRKLTLLISLLIFSAASILAAFSQTIILLFFMRLVQGLAISGQVLNIRAIAADVFDGIHLRRVSIHLATTWALSPVIGPLIGGYLQIYFGWQGCFYFLAFYGLIIAVLIGVYLPETNHKRQLLHCQQLIKNYNQILHNWTYLKNILGLTLSFSIINVLNIMGPFIIQNQLHKSALFYAQLAFAIGIIGFIGSITNRFLIHYFSLSEVIRFCSKWMLTISLIGFLFSIWLPLSVWLIVIPTSLMLFTCLMIYPNFSANCSGMFKHMAGTAAAYRGVVSITGTAILTAIMSQLQSSCILIFFSIYVVLAALIWMIIKIK